MDRCCAALISIKLKCRQLNARSFRTFPDFVVICGYVSVITPSTIRSLSLCAVPNVNVGRSVCLHLKLISIQQNLSVWLLANFSVAPKNVMAQTIAQLTHTYTHTPTGAQNDFVEWSEPTYTHMNSTMEGKHRVFQDCEHGRSSIRAYEKNFAPTNNPNCHYSGSLRFSSNSMHSKQFEAFVRLQHLLITATIQKRKEFDEKRRAAVDVTANVVSVWAREWLWHLCAIFSCEFYMNHIC